MSVIKGIGRNDELPSVTVSPANFASFVTKLLTERQHKVEVWSENKSARGGWAVSKRGSPGNLESFEDVIFDAPGETQDTPTALCIQVIKEIILKCPPGFATTLGGRHGCGAFSHCKHGVISSGAVEGGGGGEGAKQNTLHTPIREPLNHEP